MEAVIDTDLTRAYRERAVERDRTAGAAVPGGRAVAWALGSAAALAGIALLVGWQARRTERRNPPRGRFVEVDGVRLHYIDVGDGPPVVLLHGNSSMLQDVEEGIVPALAARHRVIAFDRPGFGHSSRPKDRTWTPEAQADLFRAAWERLGVERPIVYGHSWSAAAVLCLALDHADAVRGVVAASGYYVPTRRPDAALSALNAVPVLGPVLRNTVSPLVSALIGNALVAQMFAPNPVPEAYARFPKLMAIRPSQLRASAEDAATLRPWAKRTQASFEDIRVPVTIVAGADDRVAGWRTHALELHRRIPGAQLRVLPDTGHMVHHARAAEVVAAIEAMDDAAAPEPAAPFDPTPPMTAARAD